MAKLHYPTRMAKSCLAILEHPQGISGLMIDFNYFISSGRNEVNDLINNHDVHIIKTDEKMQKVLAFIPSIELLTARTLKRLSRC